MLNRVLFRADASTEIGSGHVMRCLTLANALREQGGKCHFITRELPGNLAAMIRGQGFECHLLPPPAETKDDKATTHSNWLTVSRNRDAEETRSILQTSKPDWVVVDHYALDAQWEQAAIPESAKLMVIDDLADRRHEADLLLDQNLGRQAKDYAGLVPESCRLLIGPRYALLRPQFAERRADSLLRRQKGQLEHILVSMGGVDAENITSRVLEALRAAELPYGCRITAVLGKNAPWYEEVAELASEMNVPTEVLRDVEDMAALMADADLAIGGAGISAWERCVLGLPTMLVPMAENQLSAADAMIESNAAIDAGYPSFAQLSRTFRSVFGGHISSGQLTDLSERAAAICDGDGTARVFAEITPAKATFRDARLGDSRRIWEWRRFPDRLRFSKTGADPGFAEHHEWFVNALANPDRKFRILELGALPSGYVRLDRTDKGHAKISICLAEGARGKRLAGLLLGEAERMARELSVSEIDAEIHEENRASLWAFESAGYEMDACADSFFRYRRMLDGAA